MCFKLLFFSLQGCFTIDFVSDVLSNCVFGSSKFYTGFFSDCTKFCSVF